MKDVILTIEATRDVMVRVGDRIQRGETLSEGTAGPDTTTCPISGTITAIDFDPKNHEFAISIRPEA